jgi:cytochrome c oxidase accessory protein FixG
VLLDPRSLVVGYDARRGEPRAKGKPRPDRGDCIDCSACVVACPTGIDIREGLQMECLACTQCIDACDRIMDRIGKPRGLVRYGSEHSLASGEETRMLRTRVLVYPILLAGFVIALFVTASRIGGADVTVLRGIGAPFVVDASGVRNQLRVKIENRSDVAHDFTLEIADDPELRLIAPENPLPVAAGTHQTTSVFVIAPRSVFKAGIHSVKLRIRDGAGTMREVSYKLLGPFGDT